MTTLRRGARGGEVVQLQATLTAAGFSPGAADGVFGRNTDAAVRAFQSAHGLTVDGIAGPETWAALLSSQAEPLAPAAPRIGPSTATMPALAPAPAAAPSGLLALIRRPRVPWSVVGVGLFVAWVLYQHGRRGRRRGRK